MGERYDAADAVVAVVAAAAATDGRRSNRPRDGSPEKRLTSQNYSPLSGFH